jgi:Flp pilus assembly protein TadG
VTALAPAPRLIRRLAGDQSALAAIEFGMALPVLLILGLAGLETANLALARLKVSNIAMMTADNAARVRDSIDESDVNELFAGARSAGASINFSTNGRVILSSIEPNTAGTGQWIRWQRCLGVKNVSSAYGAQGKGQNDATLQAVGPVGNQISAQSGTAILVAEVNYTYQPLISNRFLGTQTITYVSAFNVRQRTDQTLHNGASVAAATCDKFTS